MPILFLHRIGILGSYRLDFQFDLEGEAGAAGASGVGAVGELDDGATGWGVHVGDAEEGAGDGLPDGGA